MGLGAITRTLAVGLTTLAMSLPIAAQERIYRPRFDAPPVNTIQVSKQEIQEFSKDTPVIKISPSAPSPKTVPRYWGVVQEDAQMKSVFPNSLMSEGEPYVSYVIINLRNVPDPQTGQLHDYLNPLTNDGIEALLASNSAHFSDMSGDRFNYIVWGWHPVMSDYTVHLYDYALEDFCDPAVREQVAHYLEWAFNYPMPKDWVHARLYLYPDEVQCDQDVYATRAGTSDLPLRDGGLGNRAHIFGATPFNITWALGMNLGLGDANIEHEDNVWGIVRGDTSSLMGKRNTEGSLSDPDAEMRGLSNQKHLLWTSYEEIFRDGVYYLSALEDDTPMYPQMLAFRVPGAESYFLTFALRNGSDGKYPDGTLAPLEVDDLGVHVKRNRVGGGDNQYHYDVMQQVYDGVDRSMYNDSNPDPKIWEPPTWWYSRNDLMKAHVHYIDQDMALVEITIRPEDGDEGLFAPGTCLDSIDNDNDHMADFTGNDVYHQADRQCPIPWTDIEAPHAVQVGSEFLVTCVAEQGIRIPRAGPQGAGFIGNVGGDDNVGRFHASELCGQETQYICASDIPGAQNLFTPSTTVTTICPPHYRCNYDTGACERPRIHRPSGRVMPE